ncbi:MAG: hypothetical protein AB7N54_19990 [Alphaproteobacteria bacterium]
MFRFEPKPEVLWPVTIGVPADKGLTTPHTVHVRYRVLPQEEIDEALRQPDDAAMLAAVVTGWGDDVLDENGVPVPFTAEALKSACRWSYVRVALVDGFFRAQAGARTKNSPTPPAAGPA